MSASFAATLKRLRESRDVSQKRLAERSQFNHSFISRLESGQRSPTRAAVKRLADALQLRTDETVELIEAAGFQAIGSRGLFADAPECRDLLRFLSDDAVSPARREIVRSQVRGLLTLARARGGT